MHGLCTQTPPPPPPPPPPYNSFGGVAGDKTTPTSWSLSLPLPSPATLERRHEDMKRIFWSQRAICDLGTLSKILEGAKLLYHSNSGGKGVGLLIFVVLGMWTLDRVTSGGGAATWGIMFLGQLWWCALLDMDHIMGGKWYWSLLCSQIKSKFNLRERHYCGNFFCHLSSPPRSEWMDSWSSTTPITFPL